METKNERILKQDDRLLVQVEEMLNRNYSDNYSDVDIIREEVKSNDDNNNNDDEQVTPLYTWVKEIVEKKFKNTDRECKNQSCKLCNPKKYPYLLDKRILKNNGQINDSGFMNYAEIHQTTWRDFKKGNNPQKPMRLKLMIALELTHTEATEFLRGGNFAFDRANPLDQLIEAIIKVREERKLDMCVTRVKDILFTFQTEEENKQFPQLY